MKVKSIIIVTIVGVLVIVGGFLFFSKSTSKKSNVPHTTNISSTKAESNVNIDQNEISTDELTEYKEMEEAKTAAEQFIKTFFTYKKVGDNRSALEKLSTENLKNKFQDYIRMQEMKNNTQNYGNITYKSSEMFYHRINENQFNVIADVQTTFDLLDEKGNVLKKGFENTISVMLLGEREAATEPYKIRELTYIVIEVTDSTLK